MSEEKIKEELAKSANEMLVQQEISDEELLGEEQPVEEVVEKPEPYQSKLIRPISLLYSPVSTMKSIKYDPNILLPIIITLIFPFLYYLLFWDIYSASLLETILAAQPQLSYSPDAVDLMMKTTKISTLVATPITLLVSTLIPALIIFVIGKILKLQIKFIKVWSMQLNISTLFIIIKYGINFIMGVATKSTEILAPVTSLATLLTDGPQAGILYYLLAPIDLLNILAFVLTYLGLRIVCNYSKVAASIYIALSVLIAFGSSMVGYFMTLLQRM